MAREQALEGSVKDLKMQMKRLHAKMDGLLNTDVDRIAALEAQLQETESKEATLLAQVGPVSCLSACVPPNELCRYMTLTWHCLHLHRSKT